MAGQTPCSRFILPGRKPMANRKKWLRRRWTLSIYPVVEPINCSDGYQVRETAIDSCRLSPIEQRGLLGEKTYPAFNIPTDSTLTLGSSENVPGYVHFSGQATVRARFTVLRHPKDYKRIIGLVIEPDSESIGLLPYLTEREIDEVPDEIVVTITERAVELLLESDMSESLNRGDDRRVHGNAVFVIDNFAAGFECDQPYFLARVVDVEEIVLETTDGEVPEADPC